MKLFNEFKKAQSSKDYARVNELRLAMDKEAETMPDIEVQGIAGTSLFNWQGGIGMPPSAVKVRGKWFMLDCNDPRRRKIHLVSPVAPAKRLQLIGRLYHSKYRLTLITIDDLREMLQEGLAK